MEQERETLKWQWVQGGWWVSGSVLPSVYSDLLWVLLRRRRWRTTPTDCSVITCILTRRCCNC